MTQKELENIIPLHNEIKQLTSEVRDASLVHETVQGSDAEFPYILHNDKVYGYDDETLANKQRLKKCKEEYAVLVAYIDNIEDSLIRQILRYKYVYGLSFQSIAFKIGHHDEQYPRRKHNKFLRIDENDEKKAV